MNLPYEHYCKKHQGNTSHYAEENCTVCASLKAQGEQAKLIAYLRAENKMLCAENKRLAGYVCKASALL